MEPYHPDRCQALAGELIAAGTWPDRWTGEEPLATEMLDLHFSDGTVQPLIPGLFGE